QPAAAKAANPDSPKSEEAKLLDTVRAALERNAQEIKALKEQNARDMEEQRKKIEAQQAQIQALQRNSQVLEERLKAAQATTPNPAGGQNPQGPDRPQRLTDIQQRQLKILDEQLGIIADEVDKMDPAIEKLQSQTGTLDSRATQAAQRDRLLADARDSLLDS